MNNADYYIAYSGLFRSSGNGLIEELYDHLTQSITTKDFTMPILWPEKLTLASLPTPLQPLKRISAYLNGPRLWVKRDDITGSTLSGNKIRKFEFIIADALKNNHDVIITSGSMQSNHCRTTALVCAQLGLPFHLLLRGQLPDVSDGNTLLDQLAGATITTYEHSRQLPEALHQCVENYRKRGYKPYVVSIGGSSDVGLWGYLSACKELKQDFEQFNLQPDYIVVATGSGGTQAGLTVGNHIYKLNSQVLGMAVCNRRVFFERKVQADINAWQARYNYPLNTKLPILVNDDYIGRGYAITGDEIFNTIAWVAREEGLILDPVYTGKAFHGLITEIKEGRIAAAKDIVFIHTGGLFGLFPYREAVSRAAHRKNSLFE